MGFRQTACSFCTARTTECYSQLEYAPLWRSRRCVISLPYFTPKQTHPPTILALTNPNPMLNSDPTRGTNPSPSMMSNLGFEPKCHADDPNPQCNGNPISNSNANPLKEIR